ncbi:MAG: ketoacyl-ACP synthase III [Dokdonella sp.]|uniref:ketoacyl-ACP synthase III n=1 Tax=Dokdonella sp. TaxID=2291710 RepID=UPI0025C08A9A|nr:ketoacyl-ACP synthase III [Dokdonella sp.]MBZ0224262.1 ketoacyl-ACP synthase III [Dokdonella sp.]
MSAIQGIAVRGIAACVPTKVSQTDDYDLLAPEERQRLQKATGIAAHRVSPPGQCTSDLCQTAAEQLLDHLDWERGSVGALVLLTQTPDQPIPATGIVLQDKLGLPSTCLAFDINLGCSAFPYGLATLASMMATLGISRALLLMGDISRVCAYADKSAWPLFGDAGSATALEIDHSAPSIHVDLMSDGSGRDAIIIPGGGLASRLPPGDWPAQPAQDDDGMVRHPANLRLRGADIFSFAITKVPPSIQRTLDAAGKMPGDVDYLVLHQANKMINDTITKKAHFSAESSLSSLAEYGNTSSASIPLTVCAHAQRFDRERLVAACGFGVGLSWGTALFSLPAGGVLPLIESDHVY